MINFQFMLVWPGMPFFVVINGRMGLSVVHITEKEGVMSSRDKFQEK